MAAVRAGRTNSVGWAQEDLGVTHACRSSLSSPPERAGARPVRRVFVCAKDAVDIGPTLYCAECASHTSATARAAGGGASGSPATGDRSRTTLCEGRPQRAAGAAARHSDRARVGLRADGRVARLGRRADCSEGRPTRRHPSVAARRLRRRVDELGVTGSGRRGPSGPAVPALRRGPLVRTQPGPQDHEGVAGVRRREATLPPDIPASPVCVYGTAWTSAGDWLGTNSVAPRDRVFLPWSWRGAWAFGAQVAHEGSASGRGSRRPPWRGRARRPLPSQSLQPCHSPS